VTDALVAAAELTGVPAESAHRISGSVYEVELADGDLVVAKRHAQPSAVLAEAKSLDWIAEPGVIPVPAVRGHNEHWLIIEQIEPGSPHDAEAFGRGLASLHLSGAPAFGAAPPDGPSDAWIGLAPMSNQPVSSWPEFYAAQRVEPYLRRTTLPSEPFDAVCSKLAELVPEEPPARLHGDLWSGNVHWATDGRAWLIDPAAHGGHRETDLAMLHLFGCPLLDRVLGAYNEVYPLAPGWQARVPLHQLFPLLVHVVLFGSGYAGQALSAARSALRA
jgi:fructosamine-3-kinase